MKQSIGAKPIIYLFPVFVIGTYDKAQKPNAMTASWTGICCSQPLCVMVSLRKATASYTNILERKAFTVNIPSEKNLEAADYFGIATGRETNKFIDTGLTPVKSQVVDAPYIEEFPLIVECRLQQTLEIGLHTEFIGEILDIKVEKNLLDSDNLPIMEKLKPFFFLPEKRTYYGLGKQRGNAFAIGKKIKK